jgi:hypothetical protein
MSVFHSLKANEVVPVWGQTLKMKAERAARRQQPQLSLFRTG